MDQAGVYILKKYGDEVQKLLPERIIFNVDNYSNLLHIPLLTSTYTRIRKVLQINYIPHYMYDLFDTFELSCNSFNESGCLVTSLNIPHVFFLTYIFNNIDSLEANAQLAKLKGFIDK